MRKLFRKMFITILLIVAVLSIAIVALLNQPKFGRFPKGERQARIERSPNFRNGQFQNLNPTPMSSTDKSRAELMYSFFFEATKNLKPTQPIPHQSVDFKSINPDEDILIWFGHSSLYMQLGGKKILIDPVVSSASPFSFLIKPYEGTNALLLENLPQIDYLLITHDHWDHLDYDAMIYLKDRVGKVLCPLGVGEHLEYWGFDNQKITESDWNESYQLNEQLTVHVLPSRHFAGRSIRNANTLWASYLFQYAGKNIYHTADTGYDSHFAEIKKRFGTIDWAIMENGQYNNDWRYIHMLPDDLVKAVNDLNPKQFITVHNSKYALARHAWDEPMELIYKASQEKSLPLRTPMIGEIVRLNDTRQAFGAWWKNLK